MHPEGQLLATSPNQVWSWDFTKLLGPVKWTYFYLYMIIDIYSRYVPGWLLAHRESAELAERLLADTIRKQHIVADQLTIHADRDLRALAAMARRTSGHLRSIPDDAEAALRQVLVPLLAVVGDKNPALPEAQRLSETVPNA